MTDRGRSRPIVADRGPVIKIALAKTRKKMPNKDSTIVYCSAEIKRALAKACEKMPIVDCTVVYCGTVIKITWIKHSI